MSKCETAITYAKFSKYGLLLIPGPFMFIPDNPLQKLPNCNLPNCYMLMRNSETLKAFDLAFIFQNSRTK